ncbi:MAG TPA: 50S ribosomal protein L11 methyltransferase [Verrucomicrobiae bacterium]|nr:50S ribosomal protein L11 methyltransferase [Verrucomicrobiae bacterium]
MSKKPLWRISVTTYLEAEDAVTELLGELAGGPAAAYFNLETRVSIISVFGDKPFPKRIRADIADGLKRIKDCGLNIGAGTAEIAKVKREDWAESWKKHFKPIEIGHSLLVKPSWIKQKPRKGQAVIILDPGLSFGTGQHPTTSFCLGEIARLSASSDVKSFLDIGTGSGILAIGAAKLGYKPVSAFDFDPESVRVAKANARVNDVERKLKITRGDVTKLPPRTAKKFDLVCANLISNLLIAEKKKIVAQVQRDGTLVLAGILAAEFSLVQRAFEDLGLKLVASKVENEWRSGSFCFA